MLIAFPHPPGEGGPGSFQTRFESELVARGFDITHFESLERAPDIIIVVGGTRRLLSLMRWKLHGVPVIYRLDGIPWLHRKRWVGMRNFLLTEVRNLTSKLTHAALADAIVYQSAFAQAWWERSGWRERRRCTVIHNGVDLEQFQQDNTGSLVSGRPSVICVEGHLDYSPYAIDLLNELADRLAPAGIGITVYGGFRNPNNERRLSATIDYRGRVARSSIHKVYRGGIYLSLDVNAACPNTVAEAMASGLPVVGFDTGSLGELVAAGCGRVVPYGGDPWSLDRPDVEALSEAVVEVADDYARIAGNAREHAVQHFNINEVTARYLELIRAEARDAK